LSHGCEILQRQTRRPPAHPANPGNGATLTIAFSAPTREWTRHVDLADVLRTVLAKGGWTSEKQDHWLVTGPGLWLRPQIASFQPQADGLVRTCTTIEVAHPLKLDQPCFEFQHAIGETFG